MIGPTKLSSIRAQVRKSFKMTDAELLAWFNRQLRTRARSTARPKTEIDTLRLLRDALVQESKRPKRKRGRRQAATKS